MQKFNLLSIILLLFILVPLHFAQDPREELLVPKADSGAVTIDGIMDEAAWGNAAEINLVTGTEYNIFANKYYREGLTEPEFDELYARLLWSKDTLYVFVHVDEFVNDSTDLFWVPTQDGHWGGDQLFISLSNRLGVDMKGWYDGNVYAAPNGPYHFLILGENVTLNGDDTTFVPDEYRGCPDDSQKVFLGSDVANYAVTIDMDNGVWDVEMAIYNPNITDQSSIGFNIGGSMGSTTANAEFEDAYGYYTWQPNIPDDPFGDPTGNGDPGFFNLANADYWALLNFLTTPSGIREEKTASGSPAAFNLYQNYPNPFNPTTTIKFEIASQSPVYLKIYNIVGEEVAALVNGTVMNAGTYSASFDAANLASGIYFYELKADNFVISKKMVLLK